jgi:methylated-DNA-[protein]-cysteine S-methyltransferase
MDLQLTLGTVKTPLGAFLVAADEQGILSAAEFADCEARLHRLLDRRLKPSGYQLAQGSTPSTIAALLDAYFDGDLDALRKVPLSSRGTGFQERVWAALREIEPGHPVTYAGLAQKLGRARSAARAIGHANATNPFSIIVPCHRLVGATGALTGYAGGLERKRWLLDHERKHAVA